jgi:hypothetical protein
MPNYSTSRNTAQTIQDLACILSEATGEDENDLFLRISQIAGAWSGEIRQDYFLKLFIEFDRFIEVWRVRGQGPDRPLSVDAIAETAVLLGQAGLADGSLLAYLSAVTSLLDRLGFLTSEFRAGIYQLRKNYSERSGRRPWRVNVPTLHAEVVHLVRGANPGLPRDVRNVVMVLIVFEGMAQFTELMGPDFRNTKAAALQVGDVRFETSDTALITLVPNKVDGPRRTVRLSVDATAWLKHWFAVRGDTPGPLFRLGHSDLRKEKGAPRYDRQGPRQFSHLAKHLGTGGYALSAESLRLGRAVGLLDAGWSMSRVATSGGWPSAAALYRQLDHGLNVLPKERRRREPGKLWWPRPNAEGSEDQEPVQMTLWLVDKAA